MSDERLNEEGILVTYSGNLPSFPKWGKQGKADRGEGISPARRASRPKPDPLVTRRSGRPVLCSDDRLGLRATRGGWTRALVPTGTLERL